ncbi:bile acid:sodium symporter family protein [Leptospira ilyithenensis]|uniref:Bile acid:sodium symporter family protein n=1 Tax=Leptospira ilyithenensis TaxID=2484901 RepID=A0A4R9LUR0_9LEPT|nr:bile acid:sodium symporter family protein [Leptospira ilyithenensis]TGN14655.1 bile acid:sodium symporter family protein [Leptospira ilyithenensis]
MNQILERIVNAFPWILLGFSILSFLFPVYFVWFQGPWITYSLGGIMLGMGLTLKLEDFVRVFKMPLPILLGTVLQYTVMPFLGWSIGILFNLPEAFAIGLILVSCCPGGTASNVITYLAKGDLPLSVTLTSVSTMLAVIITPVLASFLIGNRLQVDTFSLLLTTFKVILVPVTLGVFLQTLFPKFSNAANRYSPVLSVILVAMIVSSILGAGRKLILASDFRIFASVFLLHAGGFGLGYFLTRVFYRDSVLRRTISIEVGMQNSGLGAVLAKSHFADPSTAIPSAVSSLMHSLIGSFLAGYWRRKN